MYWADPGTKTIRRADMDNPMETMEVLVDKFDIALSTNGIASALGDDFNPTEVALDLSEDEGTIYWTAPIKPSGKIQRWNLDGTGQVQTLVDKYNS
jgi:hypothetical protein